MATANRSQSTDKALQAAIRRYLRAVDKAIPHVQRMVAERERVHRLQAKRTEGTVNG